MSAKQEQIFQKYQQEAAELEREILSAKRSIDQTSILRLVVFFAGIVLIYAFGDFGWLYISIIVLLMLVVFAGLIARQSKQQGALDHAQNLNSVVKNELDHFQSAANFYTDGETFSSRNHAYTDDLDIFGAGSLYQFINRCKTVGGNRILATWLQHPATKIAIEQRQKAVTELAAISVETQDFRSKLISLKGNEPDLLANAIQNDLNVKLAFTAKNALQQYVKIVPFLVVALIIGAVFSSVFLKILGATLLFNFFMSGIFGKQVNLVYAGFSRSGKQLGAFASILKWIEEAEWQSVFLKDLASKIACQTQQKAHKQIAQLAQIMEQFDYRLNMIVGAVLNLLILWDLRCCMALAKWQQAAATNVTDSFEVIATFEATISLATLSYNHPDWPLPIIVNDIKLEAAALGHPLINENQRVNNDFRMETKLVDVITGSNMAGKSTFLRTLGINLVLAYAGAPVCAKSLTASVTQLVSYMRIKDSLNESTSTFKAELDRLKMILEKTASQPDMLVLIDEMLRGTNSKDKYEGSKAFIERLISQKTAALVATHDLQIADLAADYPGKVRNFHFDIRMENQEMFFDYKMKAGACKTFNAAILLREIGLEVNG